MSEEKHYQDGIEIPFAKTEGIRCGCCGQLDEDIIFKLGFETAIEKIKESLNKLRMSKRTNMTADYAWALEDIDNLIQRIIKDI